MVRQMNKFITTEDFIFQKRFLSWMADMDGMVNYLLSCNFLDKNMSWIKIWTGWSNQFSQCTWIGELGMGIKLGCDKHVWTWYTLNHGNVKKTYCKVSLNKLQVAVRIMWNAELLLFFNQLLDSRKNSDRFTAQMRILSLYKIKRCRSWI